MGIPSSVGNHVSFFFFKCVESKLNVSIKAIKLDNGLYADLDMEKMTDPSMTILAVKDLDAEQLPDQLARVKNANAIFWSLNYKTQGTKVTAYSVTSELNNGTGYVGLGAFLGSTPYNFRSASSTLVVGDKVMPTDDYFRINNGTVDLRTVDYMEFPSGHTGIKICFGVETVEYVLDVPAGQTIVPTSTFKTILAAVTTKIPNIFVNFDAGFNAYTNQPTRPNTTYTVGRIDNPTVGRTITTFSTDEIKSTFPVKTYFVPIQPLSIDD